MILYSRHDCPLCEDVEDTLIRLGIHFKFVDIDENESLRKKYHTLVPVLFKDDTSRELTWPFEDQQLLEFVNE